MGRLIEAFREILDQDFFPGDPAAMADIVMEHTRMTEKDQEVLVAVFSDIYAKIASLQTAIASLPAGSGVSTAQVSQMVSDALDALPVFDPTGINGFTAPAAAVEPASSTSEQPAAAAAVTDNASATVTQVDPPAPPTPPSPYLTPTAS